MLFAKTRSSVPVQLVLAVCVACAVAPAVAEGSAGLDFARLAALREVRDVQLSPDGRQVAYTLSVPRRPGQDDDGRAWTELHVVPLEGGPSRAYVHGEVNVSEIRFTSDSRFLTYLAKRGDDEHAAVWSVPLDGGDSKKILEHDEKISTYRLSPDATRVAFVAKEAESKERKKIKKRGYKQEVFEEDWRPARVWIASVTLADRVSQDPSAEPAEASEPQALEVEGSVFGIEWSPDGKRLALSVAPRPLIDDQYMLRKVRIVQIEDARTVAELANPGKLGEFVFSPDGRHMALVSAEDPNDPREGRLLVCLAKGGALEDLLPEFEGHVNHIAWRDSRTVMFVADVGVETILGQVDHETKKRKTHLRSGNGSPVLTGLSLAADGKRAALVGQTPSHPTEVYVMALGDEKARRLTDGNPWLAGVALARQEVVRWKARDGLELEGMLLHPSDAAAGSPAPLLLMVHGGPESLDRNGWLTRYSRPGQIAASTGYAVLYPNYRGSTGRGVAFSKLGQGDAAGPEFDDLIDAVDHLVQQGIADRDRVGITGGSYGGYATAWCSTRYTDRLRAGVMFVGISNKISKGLTTEIPVEDKMVHTRFDPWTKWQFGLERSPVYHAEDSRTALLIAAGQDDTRVHPSQSLQLYRALKLIGKTPVRYVRYPGEGHGNRKAAARDDYARRLMRWMDRFVRDKGGDLPPWELDLDLGDDEDEDEAE